MMTLTRSKPRGYLLMEVMIGGAMAAVIITGIMSLVADARVMRTAAARDVVASQLVLDKLEDLRNMAPPTGGADTPMAGYTRTWTAAAAPGETLTTPFGNIAVASTEVVVTVTFQSRASSNVVRTSTARSRVYQ